MQTHTHTLPFIYFMAVTYCIRAHNHTYTHTDTYINKHVNLFKAHMNTWTHMHLSHDSLKVTESRVNGNRQTASNSLSELRKLQK